MQSTSFCNYEIEISKLQCQIILVACVTPLDLYFLVYQHIIILVWLILLKYV